MRATVRALSSRLIAAEHRLTQAGNAGDDPAAAILIAQLAAQRIGVDVIGADLDARIDAIAKVGAAIETRFTTALVDAACDAAAGRATSIVRDGRADSASDA